MNLKMINLSTFIILVFYLFDVCNSGTLPASQLAEQTLITTLLTGYNKNIRPDDQVDVLITASLQQIVAIDEKQQIMTSSSFISQAWTDVRLSWTPGASNNNTEVVMIPVKSIWIPDTMIVNSADANGYLTVSDYSLVSVSYLGIVYMILPALTVKTRCNFYIQAFPFDKQMCSINLTSWSQGSNRIMYTENSSVVIDISQYSEHPIWKLNATDIYVFITPDRVPFEDSANHVISIQLYLQRKPLFYMINGIFACLILNCVTLLAYALPFGSQIGLCMTCFMTYSVYSLNFSNLFPQQSEYIMFVTLYFLLSMFWTLLSMAWFVLCNYFTTKGEMPKLLYDFCGQLQKLFFCCFSPPKTDSKTDKKTDDIIENGSLKKSADQENKKVTITQRMKRMFCREQRVVVEDVESTKTNPTDVKPIETDDKEKPKCNFCNRCELCQVDFDKDKVKGKNKKDIESRCNALNYLVFIFVFLSIFVSNIVVWLLMAR